MVQGPKSWPVSFFCPVCEIWLPQKPALNLLRSCFSVRLHGSVLNPQADKGIMQVNGSTSPSFLTVTRAFEPGCMLYLGSYFSMSFQPSSGRSAFFAASSLLSEHLALPHIVSRTPLNIHVLQGCVLSTVSIGMYQKPAMRTFNMAGGRRTENEYSHLASSPHVLTSKAVSSADEMRSFLAHGGSFLFTQHRHCKRRPSRRVACHASACRTQYREACHHEQAASPAGVQGTCPVQVSCLQAEDRDKQVSVLRLPHISSR